MNVTIQHGELNRFHDQLRLILYHHAGISIFRVEKSKEDEMRLIPNDPASDKSFRDLAKGVL